MVADVVLKNCKSFHVSDTLQILSIIDQAGKHTMLVLKPDFSIWYFTHRDFWQLQVEPTAFYQSPNISGRCNSRLDGAELSLTCTGVVAGNKPLEISLRGIRQPKQESAEDADKPSSAATGPVPFADKLDLSGGSLSPEDFLTLTQGPMSMLKPFLQRGQHPYLSQKNPNLQLMEMLACSLAMTGIDLQKPTGRRAYLECQFQSLQRSLQELPIQDRLAALEARDSELQLSFANDGKDAETALLTRLNRQGLLQDIERNQALLTRSGPHQSLTAKLNNLRSRVSNVTLTDAEKASIQANIEQLEANLYQLLPAIKPRVVTPAEIARSLPKDGVLVEFQKYRPYDSSKDSLLAFRAPRYIALILKPDGHIRSVPLGDAAPIDEAIGNALSAIADPSRQAEAVNRLSTVSRMLLPPLQNAWSNARQIFLSPDGELHRLPFSALPVDTAAGSTLSESVQLRLLTTGRDLLRLQQAPQVRRPATLVTNPDFNARIQTLPDPSVSSPSRPNTAGQTATLRALGPWQHLDGTVAEAELLAPLLNPQVLISGRQATAAAVLQQKGPRILHIATHGFFLADAALKGQAQRLNDPLLRSGLVFSGANQPAVDPRDDGYLTAAEVTAMDLDGTELVTLSACETGLGGVRSGEGVFGLQRALMVAGARSTLLSLWKVDDRATALFMKNFYERLKGGESRSDALRHTQSDFRRHKNSRYHDIRVWGAFQLSGDWRALSGW
jgi:CHAT domain-containing protein